MANPDIKIEVLNTHGIRSVTGKTRDDFKLMCPNLMAFRIEMEMLVYGIVSAFRSEERPVRLVMRRDRDTVWFWESEIDPQPAAPIFDFQAVINWTNLEGVAHDFEDADWPRFLDEVKEIKAGQGMLRHFANVDFVPVDAPGARPN